MKILVAIVVSFFLGNIAISAQTGTEMLLLKPNGKVVIGDTSQIDIVGNYNLYVQNGMLTERVKVALRNEAQWSDHAFSKTPTLIEVERMIAEHSHLPAMPSAGQLVREGYEMIEMDAKLLAQIEWLWQYTIKTKKENDYLRSELEALKEKVDALTNSSKKD